MSDIFAKFDLTVGIECHVQLNTKSKLFSPAKNQYGSSPNENVDVVDAGLPGVLPVINQKAVENAIALGLALNCDIRKKSVFSRKHYFYPDLPKGYQISQYDMPICENGQLLIETSRGQKTIQITRIHMEEDAGKNIHVEGGNSSFVDYNRAGAPLLEVVTEPQICSSEEAMATVRALRSIVMYLGICDGNMQEGSMRADINVSVKPVDSDILGTRAEIKNLNSMKFLGQAVDYEFRRQVLQIQSGKKIVQETRLWDANKKESKSMRSKENAHDYRYFPDPDLLPLILTDEEIDAVKANLPKLAHEKKQQFIDKLSLSEYQAEVLTSEKELANYFEQALSHHDNAKLAANWIINEVLAFVKAQDQGQNSYANMPISSQSLAKLLKLIDQEVISGKIAKEIFAKMLEDHTICPKDYAQKHGLVVENDQEALLKTIDKILLANPQEVQKYKNGKKQIFGFLMGQIMKESQGKANPKIATKLLREKLIWQ